MRNKKRNHEFVLNTERSSQSSSRRLRSTPNSRMEDDSSEDVVYFCHDIFDFATITGALFVLVFTVSVIGNSLVLRVLFAYESLRNVKNLLVFNLACSDLVFTVTLPFWATHYLHHWVFGDICCKFMTAAYFVGLYSSVILLTAMTVDRFIMVVLQFWPSNSVRRRQYAMGACAAAWVLSIAASLSDAVNVKAETKLNNVTTCEYSLDDPGLELGYYLQVSLLFLLPFVIIVFCYTAILKTVLGSSYRNSRRTVVMVLCIVSAFFICWGPYNILLLIERLYKPKGCNAIESLNIAFHICQVLAYSHCCVNPLLYMLSQKVRKQLLHLLPCGKESREKRERSKIQNLSVDQTVTSAVRKSTVMLELQHS